MSYAELALPQAEHCPFCALLQRGGEFLAEHPQAVALLDRFPLHPGHALIVPRRHVADENQLTEDEREAIYVRLLPRVRTELERRGVVADGFNIGVNVGLAAGQTVGHVHVHLIPRVVGDVADPRGGVRWVVPARAAYWG